VTLDNPLLDTGGQIITVITDQANAQANTYLFGVPSSDPVISDTWTQLVEQQFVGKDFGISEFGAAFKVRLLEQLTFVNNALPAASVVAKADRSKLTLDQFNEIIDACDTSGTPEKTRPYMQQMIIVSAREDIARAYLKALQSTGQMLGTNYPALVKSVLGDIANRISEQAPSPDQLSLPEEAALPDQVSLSALILNHVSADKDYFGPFTESQTTTSI
jgi:hypothetical protein